VAVESLGDESGVDGLSGPLPMSEVLLQSVRGRCGGQLLAGVSLHDILLHSRVLERQYASLALSRADGNLMVRLLVLTV
jgi:hypothetical protein